MAERPRRIMGLLTGLGMGLIYGLVSQNINSWFLPQLPLAQPLFGKWLHIWLNVFEGGLLGFFTAFPTEPLAGVFLGAFTATTLSSLKTAGWAYLEGEAMRMSVLLMVTFLPRMVVALPVAGAIRWMFRSWENELSNIHFSFVKLALSTSALIILAMLGGTLSLYPRDARTVLVNTNNLVLLGREANSEDELPPPLLSVQGFFDHAQADYTLQLTEELDSLPIPRPFAGYGESEYGVLVRFSSGFRFGCIWTLPRPDPSCNEY